MDSCIFLRIGKGFFQMLTQKTTQTLAMAIAHEIMQGASWQEAREIVAGYVDSNRDWPNAELIETTLRRELYLLEPDHADILQHWRQLALYTMQRIDFPLYLTGSVLNGCATVYSNLRLAAFTDDPKAVEIALMQAGIDFEVIDPEPAKPQAEIAYGWLVDIPRESLFLKKDKHLRRVGIRLEVFRTKDLYTHRYKKTPDEHQCLLEASGRIDMNELQSLINDR